MLALKKQMNYAGQAKYKTLNRDVRSVFEWPGNAMCINIPTDQLSNLFTLIPLHVTGTTTLNYLQTHTAKKSASIFSGILIVTYQAILKITAY